MVYMRSAEPRELEDIVELWNRAGGPTRHSGGRAEAAALLVRDPEALVVAVIDGKVVGAVIAGWDGWRFHIYRLAVDRSARRQGIARRLMDAAHRRADAMGSVRVDAMVDPDNAIAIAFWQASDTSSTEMLDGAGSQGSSRVLEPPTNGSN
jgi:ribosomal protein S18 acetylase RimI-like enzyme